MVFNKRDLDKAFSPNKGRRFGNKKRLSGGTNAVKASTSTADAQTDSTTEKTSIRVIVRVRPDNDKEQQENFRTVVKVVDDKMLIFDPKEEENPFYYRGVAQKGRDLLKRANKELQFMFDRVFDMSATNEEVFEGTTKDIITSLLDGYNCSVFAYGATGAGKTHTMLGKDTDLGITFRTMAELFSQIQLQSEHREFNLGVTYLEVYNENVCDLLHKSGPLAIRDDGRHGIIVAGLNIITIHSPDELLTLLARGNKNRTQHPTDANAESSRSHAVFQVYVNITNKLDGQKKHVKLSMIDLAGSERASATGCKGARFKEGANINKSLLALGNCINNLADGIKHIPYRDSKLTRLLKDSLGGNCHTVMIANVGPSSLSFEDTYNTLRYANRAKKIKLNVKKNIVNCQLHVTTYITMLDEQKKENNILKQKILQLESRLNERKDSSLDSQAATNEESEKQYTEMSEKLFDLYRQKIQLNSKILALQSKDKILCCRIQCKIAADKRLRNLTTNMAAITSEEQNASGKSRVNKSLVNFKRQRDVVRIQMEAAWNELQSVETQIEAIDVTIKAKNFSAKVAEKRALLISDTEKTRSQQQYEHAKKVSSLQQCEIQSANTIIRTMSATLQNYYNLMRGYGTLTDKMKQEFKNLVKSLEGVRNIKWSDAINDDSADDFYVLVCLDTEQLDDPLNSEIPIYNASYLEDEDASTSLIAPSVLSKTFDATPTCDTEGQAIAHASPLNSTITLEETMPIVELENALVVKPKTSPIGKSETTDEEMQPRTETIKATELNNTFNLMETKSKKRTLADKNTSSTNKTPAKQARKVSPLQKSSGNPLLAVTEKENKVAQATKPPSVMSAKSIAILNKLKTDRLKYLPQLSNASLDSGSGDGTLCNKAVRVKERRALVGTHPYQKTNTAKPK